MEKTSFFEIHYNSILNPISHFESLGLIIPERLMQAVEKRKSEFLAGRFCAQQAISKLEGSDFSLTLATNDDRSPEWPAHLVGSITHTDKYAASLVAYKQDYKGIGLDAEKLIESPSSGLIEHICHQDEWLSLQDSTSLTQSELLTLIFSAKESLYKCIHPIEKIFFGFQSAQVITIDQSLSRLEVKLTEEVGSFAKEQIFSVNFTFREGMCITKLILINAHS